MFDTAQCMTYTSRMSLIIALIIIAGVSFCAAGIGTLNHR